MPIYEYLCKECKKEFEALVRNSETLPECPECGSKLLARRLSTFSASVKNTSSCPNASVCPSASRSCGCGGGCGHTH